MPKETTPKETTPKETTPKETTPKKVAHYCGKQPIAEGGSHYAPGDKILLTDDRAKALGKHVTKTKPE